MPGFQTDPIDLLWAIVVAVGIVVFAILRKPGRTNATVALAAVAAITACWVVFYLWAHFKYYGPTEEGAFNSVEYLARETPNRWIVSYIATGQGWIPGVIVFAIAWGAARLWPRRTPQ